MGFALFIAGAKSTALDPGATLGFNIAAFAHIHEIHTGWSSSLPQLVLAAYEAASKAVAVEALIEAVGKLPIQGPLQAWPESSKRHCVIWANSLSRTSNSRCTRFASNGTIREGVT
jgi:hypothetical protein